LISLHDCYIGFTGAAPQNDAIGPSYMANKAKWNFLSCIYLFIYLWVGQEVESD